MNVLPQPMVASPAAQELQHNWGWLLALGIALIILGMLALGSEFTTLAVTFTFALLLLMSGPVEIAAAFLARHWSGFLLHLLFGIMYLIVGLLMIEHPGVAADALTLMIAAAFLAGGLLRIAAALTHRFTNWGWVFLNGVITFVLGLMIWRRWPDDSEWILGLFVGIELIFTGWSWVTFALAIAAGRESIHHSGMSGLQ